MMEDQFTDRLQSLSRKATVLKDLARQSNEDDGDTLWMSSLDIIDELLDVITDMVPAAGLDGRLPSYQCQMHCPNCHATIALSADAMASAAVVCPGCGESILLANPT